MIRRVLIALSLLVAVPLIADEASPDSKPGTPVRIMLITGGCCHDYRFQTEAMQQAMKDAGVNAEWKIVNEGGNGTFAEIDLYKNQKWADGFDVVIHNECFADTNEARYIRSITAAHEAGANAVVIHCAMHTYRGTDIDDWREFLGVTSRQHDHQSNYPITVAQPDHPIMKGFPADHESAKDELYIIEKTWSKTSALATAKSERDGSTHPVFWTNQYGKARVFGTSFGHSNQTFEDKVFLTALVRGILWSAGRLK